MQALILAGGLGTRLRSVIGEQPKPMAAVAGRPFVEYLLRQLRRDGFHSVVMLTGVGADEVAGYFGDGAPWGLTIAYSREPLPLGTGGALRNAQPLLAGERFLVMNGDSLFDVPLQRLTAAHDRARQSDGGVLGTLALVRSEETARYGRVDLRADGSIAAFHEKDATIAPGAAINAGVYVLERALIDAIPTGRAVSLEREVFATHTDGSLMGVVLDGHFVDIGVPDAYAQVRSDASHVTALV